MLSGDRSPSGSFVIIQIVFRERFERTISNVTITTPWLALSANYARGATSRQLCILIVVTPGNGLNVLNVEPEEQSSGSLLLCTHTFNIHWKFLQIQAKL
jgi:hypothetical protein